MSSLLNRQPGKRNENAAQMLREKNLKKYADVYSADEHQIGQVLRLRHRQEEINPDLKYYGSYLEIVGPEIGSHLYIPTDFIADYDPEKGKVTLSVSQKIIQAELWNREPTFVAGGQDKVEELRP